MSRKLQRIEQSYLETRFAIFESTLTGPNFSAGNFRLKKNYNNLSFLKKSQKNVISQKLQRIEQSYSEARFAIFESTLTGPNYGAGNFRFCGKTIYISFPKFFLKKITKNVIP